MRKRLRNFIIPQVYDDAVSYYEMLCQFGRALEELYEILEGKLSDNIMSIITGIIMDIMYIEDEECIEFTVTRSGGNDVHEYDPTTGTMYIRGE